jgi:D-3-phosphoglycerate dehydrogenase / 2-oxoglutarate reductase
MDILCLTPLDHIPEIKNELVSIGNLIYAPRVDGYEAANLIENHQGCAVFVNPNMMTYCLDKSVISKKVSVISTASTGTNHIDLSLCKNLDIPVFSLTTDMNVINRISSTAEMAFSLMTSIIRNIPKAFDSVKLGKWNYEPFVGRQFDSLTVGILGYGRLGKKMAKYCSAFDMNVVISDPYKNTDPYPNVSLKKMSTLCDVVTLHVHINDETTHMIDKDFLSHRVDFLVNTSRGAVVKEQDVIDALESKQLVGYATDVVESELGDIENNELIRKCENLNIIITPHIGGMTYEAQMIAYGRAVENLKKWISGVE